MFVFTYNCYKIHYSNFIVEVFEMKMLSHHKISVTSRLSDSHLPMIQGETTL